MNGPTRLGRDTALLLIAWALVDAALTVSRRRWLVDVARRELALAEAHAWTGWLMFPDLFPRPEEPEPGPDAQRILALTPHIEHQWAPAGPATYDARRGVLRIDVRGTR